MYVLNQFGLVSLPAYNRSGQFPTAPALTTTIPVIGGSFDDSPDVQRFDFPYTLSWQAIAAESSFAAQHTTVDALRAMVGKRERLWRKSLDSSANQYQYVEATLLGVWQDQDTRTNLHQPINFRFNVHTHWHGGQIGDGWYLDTGEYLDSGLFLDVTDGATTLTGDDTTAISLTYDGNLPQTDIICTVTNGTGSAAITALTITLSDTDLDWSGSLAAGAALVIDGGAWSVLLAGSDDYDSLARGGSHALETWFKLENGANAGSVVVTGGTGGSTDPKIVFSCFELFA